jgi:hypothetical protein
MEKGMTSHAVIENSAMGAAAEMNLVLGNSRCRRCDGLMVQEHCMDILDDTGQMDFPALRCVQCGEVVDAVILLNRLRGPAGVNHRRSKWDTQYGGTDSVH